MGKVSTGSKDLDGLFNYDSSTLTTIYGEAATGKTTLALLLTIAQARKKKVLSIDTENGFSSERLKQLTSDYKDFIGNIVRVHPASFEEQEKIILNIPEKFFSAVVIDTIGFFYRLEVKQDPYKTNKSLDVQLRKLTELAKKEVFVLMTNQVYASLDGKINVVGGEMMKNWSRCLVALSKNPRKLKVEKPFELEVLFDIKEKGIFRREF